MTKVNEEFNLSQVHRVQISICYCNVNPNIRNIFQKDDMMSSSRFANRQFSKNSSQQEVRFFTKLSCYFETTDFVNQVADDFVTQVCGQMTDLIVLL